MADRYISLKPSDAVHGAAMVPEGEYNITDAKMTTFNYGGRGPEVPALGVEYTGDDQVAHAQFYSAGDPRNLEPSEDKKRLKAKEGATITGLNDQTNLYAFLRSLVNAGLSEDKLSDDISVIIGARVEVGHDTAPERQIGDKTVQKKLIPVIRKVISLPGEKETKKKAAAKKPANGSETAMTEQFIEKATRTIIGVLKSNHGQLEKKTVSTAIFKTMPASDPDRGDILNLLVNDQFLKDLANDGVFYDAASGNVQYVGD